jgi:hypothetical protein
LDCKSGDPGSIIGRRSSLLLRLIMKSFLRSFALYLCSGRSFSSLRTWRQLVLLNCSTACPGTMRWWNCALVSSTWLTAVIRSENYQHHHQQQKQTNDLNANNTYSVWHIGEYHFLLVGNFS